MQALDLQSGKGQKVGRREALASSCRGRVAELSGEWAVGCCSSRRAPLATDSEFFATVDGGGIFLVDSASEFAAGGAQKKPSIEML